MHAFCILPYNYEVVNYKLLTLNLRYAKFTFVNLRLKNKT